MRQLYDDLWQTDSERPFPYLVTRAYLLDLGAHNLLIYNTGLEHEIEHIARLGGISRQYLSHIHEAGPSCARISGRFSSQLWCRDIEAVEVSAAAGLQPHHTFTGGDVHYERLRIVAAPGHTPGSNCLAYSSPTNRTYLFTGDTLGVNSDGVWVAGYIRGLSDLAALGETIEALRKQTPDIVISSAFGDAHPVNEVTPAQWQDALDQAAQGLEDVRNGGEIRLS